MKYFIFLVALLILGCQQSPKTSTSSDISDKIDYTQLRHILDSINIEDQKYRSDVDSINKAFGWSSDEMKDHWTKINEVDASNLVIVEDILAKHGWLSAEQVGGRANSTLFLVIQHSNQDIQEKYLPMMRQAVKDGNANASSLALLEDRIGLGKGELQVYGSQVGTNPETQELYVLPLIDPDNVNQRRAEVGLGSIEDYISNWDLKWDVEEYKKNLPAYLELQK